MTAHRAEGGTGGAVDELPTDLEATLKRVRRRAHGMLHPAVYPLLYRKARQAAPGSVVEVGTAHGAATVTLALGRRDAGREGRVFSFEKFTGGSVQRHHPDRAEAEAAVRDNLAAFGVEDRVTLVVGDVESEHRRVLDAAPFSLLLLDADGAIDRDFRCFYNELRPGATIVVDDCEERVKLKRPGLRRLRVDLKHLLTFHLVEFFLEEGLLEEEARVHGTFFGRKPREAARDVDFSAFDFAAVYRECVFTEGRIPSLARMAYDRIDERAPAVAAWIRRIRERVT